jgi:hypothetical protein
MDANRRARDHQAAGRHQAAADPGQACAGVCRVSARVVARGETARTLRRHSVAASATLAHVRSAALDLVLTIADRAGNHRQVRQALSLRR